MLCIFSDPEKPPISFFVLRLSLKPPCMVLRLAFLAGTPGHLRRQVSPKLWLFHDHKTIHNAPTLAGLQPAWSLMSFTGYYMNIDCNDQFNSSVLHYVICKCMYLDCRCTSGGDQQVNIPTKRSHQGWQGGGTGQHQFWQSQATTHPPTPAPVVWVPLLHHPTETYWKNTHQVSENYIYT